MAIAHQTHVLGAVNSTAGNYDTSITPAAAPNGACVVLTQNASVADIITSVTYGTGAGAIPLVRRRFNTESTEPGAVYIYWAGGGNTFPSGAQTVRVVRTGTTNLRAAIYTMTVTAGQQVDVDADATGGPGPASNPSWTMTTTVATTQCYEAIHSGLQAMTTTPATNWVLEPTQAAGDLDLGSQGRGFARYSFTTGPGNAGPGWTAATSEDFVGASIAFKEVPPPQVMPDPIHAATAGRHGNPGRVASDILNP
jgi:hypothetical protein